MEHNTKKIDPIRAEAIALLLKEKERLGSMSKVATRLGLSAGTLSLFLDGSYSGNLTRLANQILIKLGTRPGWNIAETGALKLLSLTLKKAREYSFFVGISDRAGSGKSAIARTYVANTPYTYLLQATEWNAQPFLKNFMKVLGIAEPKGYVNIDTRMDMICKFFIDRKAERPQVIIDEADKLRPSALRCLIPLFNRCEDVISVAILGTENLEQEIKRGVSYKKKGYDEIDSRFGRHYHKLIGASEADVIQICLKNGLDKQMGKQIWDKLAKVRERVGDSYQIVVRDLRLLKRYIITELSTQSLNEADIA